VDKNPRCPLPSVLVDLIDGQLVEPELSDLSRHLEDCPACQERARTLSPSDTLVELLRGEAPAEDEIARAVPRPLIERLKQIPNRASRAGSDAAGPEFPFLVPEPDGKAIGRLGPYRLLRVLGRGGMGAVFLADDPKLERQVALKVMLPRLAADRGARERFLREARAAARLKSDHVVTIYQVDEADGVPFLAMELLEGQSLEHVLRAGPPPGVARILAVARDVARGLAAAHEKGLVHRDIKPSNLWVEGEPGASATGGRVKILDFGLARAATEDVHLTQSGAVLGTPAYLAPEQARGGKSVDARADLFSLGCVLYRLAAGDVPFQAETTMATLLATALDDPVPLSRRNPSVPPALSGLIMQLLHKDPARRPQSARDVIARLVEIERSLPGSGPALPATGRPSRKRRALALVGVGLFLAALGVLAGSVLFWQTPDGRVVRIDCDDPAVKVAFEDGEFKVAGAYKEPITLKPGKVGLKVKKGDDFEFETDKLIVNNGDKIVLRIEVVPGRVRVVQDGKGELDSKALTLPSKGERWERAVAQMDAADQVKAVVARLKELNPNFAEKSVSHRIENGVVVDLEVYDALDLHDLTPLRALAGLKGVHFHGKWVGAADISPLKGLKLVSFQSNACPHTDLSPLAGMPLTTANFWGYKTDDLSPLRGMKLVGANLGSGPARDISVLKGMPLEALCLNFSQVEDLSPLAGAPLKRLEANHIKVKDLSPLVGSPLEFLSITGTPLDDYTPLQRLPLKELVLDYDAKRHARLLRAIPTLKTINGKPAAEVLGD
jgi:eukaryotic-like serine/threonine-protein kinase